MKEIEQLKEILAGELPGMESHLKMTPYRRLTKVIPDNRREGAVMMLLYEKDGELFFPLIQRHAYKGVHSNQISFPGGKVEESDKSLYETSRRETKEEIGVPIDSMNKVGELTQVYIPPSNFLVSAFVAYSSDFPTFVKEEREVKEIIEVPLLSLFRKNIIKNTEVEVTGGLRMKTPYLDIEGRIVWGATAAILSEFRDVFPRKIG